MLRSNRAHGAQPLSLCPAARGPRLLNPREPWSPEVTSTGLTCSLEPGGHAYWTHVRPGAHAAKQAKPPQ